LFCFLKHFSPSLLNSPSLENYLLQTMEHRSHSWGLSYENTFKSPEVVCTLGRHSLYPRMAVCLARGIGLDETTNYTENDFLHYHTLTGKDIENAPRVTDDYYFEAHPGDGYAPSNSKEIPVLHHCVRISKRWDTRRKSVASAKRKSGQNPIR
jgi:hypothetical protein